MAKKRIPIPDDIAAEVSFASDRTCCICNDATRKIEIHHLDDDPSNNELKNLVILCKDHHSEAHTKQAFARNLTPDLIRKYDKSWRAVVRARLSPSGDQSLSFEHQQQVLLEIGLAPHGWKVHYMALYPGHFRDSGDGSNERIRDVWDLLLEVAVHQYSIAEWKRYASLFDGTLHRVTGRLNQVLSAHGDVVPASIKIAVLQTNRQIEVERSVYLQLPQMIDRFENADSFFVMRFTETVRTLARLARLADSERESLEPST